MSDAPRWPGSDGGPGLDFSPYRKDDGKAEGTESPVPAPEDTQVHSPVSPGSASDAPGTPASAGSASDTQVHSPVSAGSADDTQLHSPVSAGSAVEGDDLYDAGVDSGEARGVAPVPPRVAERAARTAQEWAAMPVGPNARPAGPEMTGPAVGAAALGGAAVGGAAGAGALAGSPAPQRAPLTGPEAPVAARAAGAPEEANSLPLDEVGEPKPDAPARPVRATRRPRRTRKARLRLARLDPWSVMKTTFLFAIAFGIMMVVATFVLWSVLAGAGTIEYVNTLLNQLFGDQNNEFDVTQILSLNRILGFSAIVSAINVVIITALATLFAFLYNLAATVMGGLELTLAED